MIKKLNYLLNDTKNLKNDSVYPETVVFVLICFVDMFYTLYVVKVGIAKEAYPALIWAINISNACFILVKTLSFTVPLAIIELMKHKNYFLFRNLLRLGIVLYIIDWITGAWLVNR